MVSTAKHSTVEKEKLPGEHQFHKAKNLLLQQCVVGEAVEQGAQEWLHSQGFDMLTELPGWPTCLGTHHISASQSMFQVSSYHA